MILVVVAIVCLLTTSVLSQSEVLSISNQTQNSTLPQAIIIGVKKCGTRALLKFISSHPNVAGSPYEIHFFDSTTNFHRGLDWYRNQMPLANNNQYVTLEKTPHYFVDIHTPSRLAHLLPQTKLIIILRDPIVRAISDYVQLTNRRRRRKSFMTFDELVSLPNATRWTPIRIGCYASYLRRWLEYIPLERMHFVDGENLIRRPWEELEYVQNFLNIPITIRRKDFYFNSNKRGFPCIRQPNGCLGASKGRHHPSIHQRTREKLKHFYSTCNAQLKQLAKINFSWL